MNNSNIAVLKPKQAQRALAKLKTMTPAEVDQVVGKGNEVWQTVVGMIDKGMPYFDPEHVAAMQILVDVFCSQADEHVEGFESPDSWDDEVDY